MYCQSTASFFFPEPSNRRFTEVCFCHLECITRPNIKHDRDVGLRFIRVFFFFPRLGFYRSLFLITSDSRHAAFLHRCCSLLALTSFAICCNFVASLPDDELASVFIVRLLCSSSTTFPTFIYNHRDEVALTPSFFFSESADCSASEHKSCELAILSGQLVRNIPPILLLNEQEGRPCSRVPT